jgi:hypothetical protein
MKPEIKERWVAALRSGEYEQGVGYLNIADDGVNRYCCLGVLCDILSDDYLDFSKHVIDNKTYYGYAKQESGVLSDYQLKIIDLKFGEAGQLIALNDTDLKSFDAIADYIEEHL